MRLKPEQWEEITGIEVIDADGWTMMGDWERKISLETFILRCHRSTTNTLTKTEVTNNIDKFYKEMIGCIQDW